MIFGMTTFTFVHVLLSLVGIVAGFVMLHGLLNANPRPRWTALFFITTVATSVTGFGFPFNGFTPAIGVGIVSLLILALAIPARYVFRYSRSWRWIYVVGSVMALYLNVFVLVVQAFLKIPVLHVLAPNGSEPPFAIAQAVVLLSFIVAGIFAVRRFRPAAASPLAVRTA